MKDQIAKLGKESKNGLPNKALCKTREISNSEIRAKS